jgi:hypothetical protein
VAKAKKDVEVLCVSWKRKRPEVGELVLVTTKEAQSMMQKRTAWRDSGWRRKIMLQNSCKKDSSVINPPPS